MAKAAAAQVRACLRCGSADLRVPGVSDGVVVGMGQDFSKSACVACDWVGVPLLFDDEAARAAFAKGRTGAGSRPRT